MSSSRSPRVTTVPCALAHLLRLAPLHQAHELDGRDLEALRVVAAGGEHRLQPRDVAVVVGAEDVDQQVVAAARLVEVVGDVGGEVGGVAVRADQHPVLRVAVVGRAEPDRALRLVGVARLPQGGRRRPIDAAGLVERALREEAVEVDAEAVEVAAIAASIRSSPRRVKNSIASSPNGVGREAVPRLGADLLRDRVT